jgi:type IV secretory pathway TraG/TraD family ATPase VirD4
MLIGNKKSQIGEKSFENDFRVKAHDRRHHVYIIGKTGAGKSTLLKNMAVQDIKNGRGVAVIDPHGDLAEDLLNFIPKNRLNDVIYFNPADTRHPAGINILEAKNHEEKQMVASSLVSVFRHLWRDSWGPRTEYLLYNAVLALMDTPGQTLLGVHRILIDKAFRERIIRKVEDPMVRDFWTEVFSKYGEHFASEVISPIQNKIGQLLTSSYIRNIVGQPQSTIDLKFAIDHGQIIIANLSKGKIGEDRANLLGSVLITKLYLAALERQKIPEEARKDFYLYADEFQNFTTDVFPSILSEARKYRLNLTLAHQYLDQVPENIRQSVFGNVGTWIVFRVGSSDAGLLEKEFAPYYDLESLRTQKNYEFIYKTIRDGSVGEPSFSKILPLAGREGSEASREIVIKVSRERFARKREIVERKILRWFGEKVKLRGNSPFKK